MTSERKDVPAVEFRELVRQRAGEEVGEVQSQVEVAVRVIAGLSTVLIAAR